MMRKTLWALSLLFVLSGCNDGGEDNPPKQDRLVNTTVNIEYSLNWDTPSINYPETSNQQSEILSGIPIIPSTMRMRFIIEFWEEVPVQAGNPDAGVTYRRYGRKSAFGIEKHNPVLGQTDRYIVSHEMRLTKSKFKMLIWADYTNRSLYDNFFGTDRVSPTDASLYGLRYIVMSMARQKDYYDAFSGIQDVDLTMHEGESTSYATVNASVKRVLGKYTLIASDYKAYKNSVSPEEYENSKKPVSVKVEYGGAYGDTNPVNGFRGIYDGLNQTVSKYTANQTMLMPVISEDGEEMILTFDYALAMADNSPLKDVLVTIYGPMNLRLNKMNIGTLPLERNKETFFRGSFLFNSWESGSGVTIVDGFDDNGTPEVLPPSPIN